VYEAGDTTDRCVSGPWSVMAQWTASASHPRSRCWPTDPSWYATTTSACDNSSFKSQDHTHGSSRRHRMPFIFSISFASTTKFVSSYSQQLTVSSHMTFIHAFIHFWQAPLGVCSAKRRHQSPEWTILSHVNCCIQGEVIGFQVLLDSLHPHSTRPSWWLPAVLGGGKLLGICFIWHSCKCGRTGRDNMLGQELQNFAWY